MAKQCWRVPPHAIVRHIRMANRVPEQSEVALLLRGRTGKIRRQRRHPPPEIAHDRPVAAQFLLVVREIHLKCLLRGAPQVGHPVGPCVIGRMGAISYSPAKTVKHRHADLTGANHVIVDGQPEDGKIITRAIIGLKLHAASALCRGYVAAKPSPRIPGRDLDPGQDLGRVLATKRDCQLDRRHAECGGEHQKLGNRHRFPAAILKIGDSRAPDIQAEPGASIR